MAELQPPEVPVNGGIIVTENPSHHGLSSKRQRRPSVRLGDIGDQSASLLHESYRRNKLWSDTRYRFYPQKYTGTSGKSSSRTRPLTNLGNGHETLESLVTLETQDKNVDVNGEGNLDLLALTNPKGRDLKGKRGVAKRVRSNWVSSKLDEGYDKFSGDEWYRGFDADQSESPLKEQSPIHSLENTTVDLHEKDGIFSGQKRPSRTRGSESRDHGAVELDVPSDADARDWKCRASVDRNGVCEGRRSRSLEDGVRMWLNGLGLGRYEPVFEINEVDEEVLPLLTLDDLKDMGINAVGSRRKLYSAIQKLGRGFS